MRTTIVALLLLLVASAASPATTGGDRAPHGGAFFSNCRFSHTSHDDPIVYPRQPGRSHAHTFFGNVSTNARSTAESLRAARTTCALLADTAAYWIPTLFQNGREVRPAKAQLYYVVRGYGQMRSFPAGFRMIAGNAHAQRPQSQRLVYWACGGGAGVRSAPRSSVPTCRPVQGTLYGRPVTRKTFLELHVNFPDCWDGRRLDSADHTSHVVASTNYVCPASHPVKLPLIRLNVHYRTRGGEGIALSSGGAFSGHADFFNGWNQSELRRLVRECFADRCNAAVSRARRR